MPPGHWAEKVAGWPDSEPVRATVTPLTGPFGAQTWTVHVAFAPAAKVSSVAWTLTHRSGRVASISAVVDAVDVAVAAALAEAVAEAVGEGVGLGEGVTTGSDWH